MVRIGAVRVRLSSVHVAQPSGSGSSDCCCGVPWPSRSRIPLPAAASYSRGIFSRGAAPTEPPDTRQLIVDEDAEPVGTLDRLLKTRFGGGDRGGRAKRAATHKKKQRTTDKTDRLRELTEKLKSPPAGRAEPGPSANPGHAPAPPRPDDDLFECVNLKLPKAESRTIVGSYIQRTIPFRSASFSQVDFSPVDGKYIRRGQPSGTNTPSLGVCVTLPRKKTPDTSPSSSRATSTTVFDVTEISNTSLDTPGEKAPTTVGTHLKPPNIRCLTNPLPKRDQSSEDSSPTGVDGDDTKSVAVPSDKPLEELQEESELDCEGNADRECVLGLECVAVTSEGAATPPMQTFVAKWPDENTINTEQVNDVLSAGPAVGEVSGEAKREERKESDCATNNEPNRSPYEIPKEQLSNETSIEQVSNEVEEQPPNDVRKDGPLVECGEVDGTAGEWPANTPEEPQSPEEGVKPTWPRRWLERPRLVCQSSEERDDDGGSPRRQLLARTDSLSEGESENGGRPVTPSVLGESDSEGRLCSPHSTRRYSKRPLRGPYGQMLEAEMKKPEATRKFSKLQYNEELKFLENLNQAHTGNSRNAEECQLKRSYTSPGSPSAVRTSAKRKVSANIPYSAPNPPTSTLEQLPVVHIRTTSSPSQLEGCAAKQATPRPPLQPSPQLLAHLLKGSSERAFATSGDGYNFPLHFWKVGQFMSFS